MTNRPVTAPAAHRAVRAAALLLAALSGACATPPSAPGGAPPATDPSVQVAETERAFAATMQRRDFAAFQRFLADDATFRSSAAVVLSGKAEVAARWEKFFAAGPAPFSWEPDTVTVHGAGRLAISSGPVRDPDGRVIARFTSIWRREPGGDWRIVVDQGVDACAGTPAK